MIISLLPSANNTVLLEGAQRWNASGKGLIRENACHGDHRKAAVLEFCQLELRFLPLRNSKSDRNTAGALVERFDIEPFPDFLAK